MNEVDIYPDSTAFLAATSTYLYANEPRNNLVLGLANTLVTDPLKFGSEPFFAALTDDGAVKLAALMTPSHKLIISADAPDTETLAILAEAVRSVHPEIPGVVAAASVAEGFVDVWTGMTGTGYELFMGLKGYTLTEIAPLPVPAGHARAATEDDVSTVAVWMRQFKMDTFGQDTGDMTDAAKALIAEGSLLLWDNGRPVSMCNRTRETRNGAVINLVFTPEEHRCKGYCTACVADMCRRILDDGKTFCALYTNVKNQTSNSVYQRIGFRAAGELRDYSFNDSRQSVNPANPGSRRA